MQDRQGSNGIFQFIIYIQAFQEAIKLHQILFFHQLAYQAAVFAVQATFIQKTIENRQLVNTDFEAFQTHDFQQLYRYVYHFGISPYAFCSQQFHSGLSEFTILGQLGLHMAKNIGHVKQAPGKISVMQVN
jgi:hypothetical protein